MTQIQGHDVVLGCDVSKWQGGINYGVFTLDFVFYKATGGDGGLYVDQMFRANAAGFNTAEGPYHFAGRGDAAREANFFCDTILASAWATMPRDKQLPPVLDWEPTWNPSPEFALAWCLQFCAVVEQRTGRRPLIYTGAYVPLQRDPALLTYDLWLAAYTREPIPCAPWGLNWSVWQYSSTGSVSGVQGGCDSNVARADWFARVLNTEAGQQPAQPTEEDTVTPEDIEAVAQRVATLLTNVTDGTKAPFPANLQHVSDQNDATLRAITGIPDVAQVVAELGPNAPGTNAYSIAAVLEKLDAIDKKIP